jgi:hypothetical protein
MIEVQDARMVCWQLFMEVTDPVFLNANLFRTADSASAHVSPLPRRKIGLRRPLAEWLYPETKFLYVLAYKA